MKIQTKLEALLTDRKVNAVALRVGVGPRTIAGYVKKGIVPRWHVLERLADILGVDAGWLMDESTGWPVVRSRRPLFPPPPGANPGECSKARGVAV